MITKCFALLPDEIQKHSDSNVEKFCHQYRLMKEAYGYIQN